MSKQNKTTHETLAEWLESERINGGPHGFECIGVARLQQLWDAAQSVGTAGLQKHLDQAREERDHFRADRDRLETALESAERDAAMVAFYAFQTEVDRLTKGSSAQYRNFAMSLLSQVVKTHYPALYPLVFQLEKERQ